MSIYIKGAEKLKARADQLGKVKQAFGDEAKARVQQYTPVLTGQLREGWQLSVDEAGNKIELTNQTRNKEGYAYAPVVEFGGPHTRGFFMLTRTVKEASDLWKRAKAKVGLS